MGISTFIHKALPSKKREDLINKRNVKVIKEFLRKRRKLEIAKDDDLAHLKQHCKSKSINASIYRRLKQVLIYTYEQKLMDLIKASVEKSFSIDKSIVSYDNQASEDDQPLGSIVENN
jgi:hypothetical protein